MDDTEYYRKLNALLCEVLKQAGGLVFQDYAALNAVMMESGRRLKAADVGIRTITRWVRITEDAPYQLQAKMTMGRPIPTERTTAIKEVTIAYRPGEGLP